MNIDLAESLSFAFGLASLRCEEARARPDGKLEKLLVPAIVCAAFAVELGLKALILRSGGTPWGHNLSKLFSEVPESEQQGILAEVEPDRVQFLASLEGVANAYDEWRYVYERDSLSTDLHFLRALEFAVRQRLPLRLSS